MMWMLAVLALLVWLLTYYFAKRAVRNASLLMLSITLVLFGGFLWVSWLLIGRLLEL